MSLIEERLADLGIALQEPRKFPAPNRRGCKHVGPIAYVSGHGPHHKLPGLKTVGKLGAELTIEEGQLVAKSCAIAMLASLKQDLGTLDRVRGVVRIYGMVNSAPGFQDHPKVIDGCSDLLFNVFGPQHGQHARAAVGIFELPRNQPVEIMGEFELKV